MCLDQRIGLFVYDQKLRILEWNACMVNWTGISRKESLANPIHELLAESNFPEPAVFRKALSGKSFTLQTILPEKNREQEAPRYIDLHFYPLEEGEEHHIEKVLVLIAPSVGTNGHRPDQSLSSALSTVGDFFRYAPIPVYIVDGALNLKLANQAFYEFAERKPQSIHNLKDFVPEVFQQRLEEQVQQVISTGQPLMLTEEYVLKRNSVYLYNIIFPVRNRQGVVDSVGGYFIDLTSQVSQRRQNKELLEETMRLNEMLNQQNQELQQKEAALNQANKSLSEQKDELEQLVEELSDRNYELDQIMYKTSHDLRAPLTSILGLLNLAKSEQDVGKLPEYHQFIENRVHKLDDFVKAMLTYAKSSRTEVQLETIHWTALVKDSLEHIQYLEHYDKMNIQTHFDSEEYPFQSDAMRITIILNNLLGNAIKYADMRKEDPLVRLSIGTTTKGASIVVEDNGIGIPKDYISKVFDMFFRATDRSEGSGLGLYIVKQTVELLQGSINIESKEREGTTIRVFLPHLTRQQRLKTLRPNRKNNKKDI
ncbi:ATP-binding protein [Cesiribacter andamanensis]|uniref:ATP-binding protein n=1 Tax=Cesiribacter andamanensis TaxID=649507 RepID=UPI0006851FCF|nr:ATP-binding protein [Cesiribacter andamanensis]